MRLLRFLERPGPVTRKRRLGRRERRLPRRTPSQGGIRVRSTGSGSLELDEHGVGRCLAGVASLVFLRVQPADLSCLQFHWNLPATGRDHRLERGQGHHDAVGMGVQVCRIARRIAAALRLSLDQGPETPRDARPVMRQGRAIAWIEGALEPLAQPHPNIDRRQLAVASRAGCGIEARVWMVDIAAAPRTEAATLMRESAQAPLNAALAQPPGKPSRSKHWTIRSGGDQPSLVANQRPWRRGRRKGTAILHAPRRAQPNRFF